ncbi:hypothetical protein ABZ446_01680 [Streptomyces sp. NPDC005813]|uniref:hypothetical protein n=1 Tax=Streptomyces sp. NPDC005813 TaxID=3155592 RepID=UPI0033E005F5
MPEITSQLNLGGTWTDVSTGVRTASDMTGTRGRSSWAQEADPSKFTFALDNRDGRFSPRNPLSPYYRLLSRNTPIRISVPGAHSHLEILDTTGTVTTPHSAALNITGDLDIRVEFDANLTDATLNQTIVGKWSATVSERQWLLHAYDGNLRFTFWGDDGIQHAAFIPLSSYGGQILRVTFDRANDAGAWAVRFWQADEWGGTWTALSGWLGTGSPAGIQSVTSGPLAIGVNDPTSVPPRVPSLAFAYRLQVRRGIKGLVAADLDFADIPDGATSFADSTGNTWTVSGGAEVTRRSYRLNGEVSEWPAETDDSDTDSVVSVTAQSLKRRLDSGRDPLKSVLARRIPGIGPRAYWPLEDGAASVQAYSPIDGVRPMTALNMTFASESSLPCSDAAPVVATQNGAVTSRLAGHIPPGGSSSAWSVYWLYRLNSQPSDWASYMSIQGSGTVKDWRIQISNTGSRILGYDQNGTLIVTHNIDTGADLFNRWILVRFFAEQNGGNVDFGIVWRDIGGDAGAVTYSYAGTLGRVTSVGSPPNGWNSLVDGLALAHVSVWDAVSTTAYSTPGGYGDLLLGYAGEFAADRITRLALENNIPVAVRGKKLSGERVGPQTVDTFLDAVRSATAADGGILLDQRNRNGFLYVAPSALQNKTPKLVLDYTARGHVVGVFKPVDDDQALENDSTVKREGGSYGRYEQTDGSLNVHPPESDEDGVGRYAKQVTLNLYEDEQCEGLAAWRVHLGTWDEARFPTLTVDAGAILEELPEVADLDVGDVIQLRNVPTKHSFEDLYLLVQGYSEKLSQQRWTITFNCTPYGPWVTALAGEARTDTTGSTLAAPATDTATTLYVASEASLWATSDAFPDDFPMDIVVDGERMTLTGCAPATRDTFTRTAASSWGSTTDGQAWTTSGGSASDYSVAGGIGVHSLGSVNTSRYTVLPLPSPDVSLRADVATSVLATGGPHYPHLVARWLDANNLYSARLGFQTSQALQLVIQKRVAGTQTDLVTVTVPGTHVAGTFYTLRFRLDGTLLRAKAWRRGDPEPYDWQATVTDTSLTAAGSAGVRSVLSSTNTNTLPVAFSYDNFQVTGPQRMTVVRSVNDVVKAQPLGARVSLFQMPFTALTE